MARWRPAARSDVRPAREVGIEISFEPSPSHSGQAPCGLLKENSRGSISGMVKPETGQANFDDMISRFGSPFSFSSANSTTRRPSASSSAVSIESGKPVSEVGPYRDAVHHDSMIVLELLVQRRCLGDVHTCLPVNFGALESLLLKFRQFFAIFAFSPAHDRSEQIESRPLGQGEYPVRHLADRLALDRQPGRRTNRECRHAHRAGANSRRFR